MTSSGEPKTLYLIDGTSQLFRAYFAIRGLTNDAGLPTNAVYGFTTMLRKLLKDEQPRYVAAAFDLGREVFRHETYAEYKANRPPAPEDLNVQVPYAKEACQVLGVPVLEKEGYEADDLIATFTRKGLEAGFDVVVVASDKDLLQLVGDRVVVLNPSKNLRLDADGVADSFGASPERVRDVLGLMGDSVDNIPGVPGVGEKTALAIVATHGDLESVIARAHRFAELFTARDELLQAVEQALLSKNGDDRTLAAVVEAIDVLQSRVAEFCELEADEAMRGRVEQLQTELDAGRLEGVDRRERAKRLRALKKELKSIDRGSSKRIWFAIREHAEQARISKELATLRDDVPVDEGLEQFRYRGPDGPRVEALFNALGFRSLLRGSAEEGPATAGTAPCAGTDGAPREAAERGRHQALLTADQLADAVHAARAAGRFAVDTETDDVDPMRARLVGLSLAWEAGGGVYVPVAHDYPGAPEQLSLDQVRSALAGLLADPGVAKIGQNLIYDAHVLRRHGMPVDGWALDTRVAAFLLNSSRPSYSMDSLAEEYLGYTTIKYEEVAGSGAKQVTLNRVEIERVAEYAAEDAYVTLRLADELEPRLEAAGLRELYERIDGPLLPVLIGMEARGIRVDTDLLHEMSKEMEAGLERTRSEIHTLAGTVFNIDSPKQLREVLFERLGLKPGRKTAKSRVASTDAQTLEELAAEHEIARRILEYRELAKLKGTYVDALPKLVNAETGRVHTSFNPTGAATGRLSSSDPNLQNIPARSDAGRRIRAAFVPADGYCFLSSDYSQVELRVLAHLAQDDGLIEAFRAGEDIHRFTASRVSGVAVDLVTDDMRRRAKAVNFGILYGMSEMRLAREQGISRGEARQFIRTYFERFARVRAYIEQVREQALRDAAVRTLFGRIRYFPQLHQRVNRAVQEQALRAAVNTTIQGTAADLMKLAMLRVDRALTAEGLDAPILLQVHDELLLEVARDRVDRVRESVREAMEGVHELTVPLIVDQKHGDSWLAVT